MQNQLGPSSTVKSFWDKQGAVPAVIFAILGAGVVIGGLYFLIPILTTLFVGLANLFVKIGIALVTGSALIWMSMYLFDPQFWFNLWTKHMIVMAKMTRSIVESDPIIIQENHIKKLEEKRVDMNDQISKLAGGKKVLKDAMNNNIEKAKILLKEADYGQRQAEAHPDQPELEIWKVKAGQASKLKTSNEKMQPVANQLEILYKTLQNLYVKTGFMLEDLRFEVQTNKQEYEAIKNGTNTIAAAGKFFSNNGREDEMFRMSMEFVAQDMSNRLGEIDHFMENINVVMQSIDLQQGMMQDDGLKMLGDLQNQNLDFLLRPIAKAEDQPALIAKGLKPGTTEYLNNLPTAEKQTIQISPAGTKANKYNDL